MQPLVRFRFTSLPLPTTFRFDGNHPYTRQASVQPREDYAGDETTLGWINSKLQFFRSLEVLVTLRPRENGRQFTAGDMELGIRVNRRTRGDLMNSRVTSRGYGMMGYMSVLRSRDASMAACL